MNIKRAFLTAVALMLIPGFAAAQSLVQFEVSVDYAPNLPGGYVPEVDVFLTCNAGDNLNDSYTLVGDNDVVTFNNDNLTANADTLCTVTLDGLDSGWIALRARTTGTTGPSDLLTGNCRWGDSILSAQEDGGPTLELSASNSCEFQLVPAPIELAVEKIWEYNGQEDAVDDSFLLTAYCDNFTFPQNLGVNPPLIGIQTSPTQRGAPILSDGDREFSNVLTSTHVLPWGDPTASAGAGNYPTTCWVEETTFDSAVEGDGGCGPQLYLPGDTEAECTIVNSVFFEGIPTLSQYGMAIMALLMLGVGFVGFRRFV